MHRMGTLSGLVQLCPSTNCCARLGRQDLTLHSCLSMKPARWCSMFYRRAYRPLSRRRQRRRCQKRCLPGHVENCCLALVTSPATRWQLQRGPCPHVLVCNKMQIDLASVATVVLVLRYTALYGSTVHELWRKELRKSLACPVPTTMYWNKLTWQLDYCCSVQHLWLLRFNLAPRSPGRAHHKVNACINTRARMI